MKTIRKTHQDGLTIRAFPFALRMQARAAAAGEGMDLDEWVRKTIEQAIEQGDENGANEGVEKGEGK